jgi:hypothetical protein
MRVVSLRIVLSIIGAISWSVAASEQHLEHPVKAQTTVDRGETLQNTEQSVSGTIIGDKLVKVRVTGRQNRVLLLKGDDGSRMIVDLGPCEGVESLPLTRGTEVRARGIWAHICEHQVLMAEQVWTAKAALTIERIKPRGLRKHLRGTVKNFKVVSTEPSGQQPLLLLELPQGDHVYVDLGPSEHDAQLIEPGTELELVGRNVRLADREVFLAESVRPCGSQLAARNQP